MPKASVTTKSGTKITIEGTAEEVAALVKQIDSGRASNTEPAGRTRRAKKRGGPQTLGDLIVSLIDGGFFKKPQDLGSVKMALQEIGHFYPVTTLSPTLLRLVRSRQLRRLREKNRWMYTALGRSQ